MVQRIDDDGDQNLILYFLNIIKMIENKHYNLILF